MTLSRESPLSRSFWRDPIDARPAALLRIGLGLLIVFDLLERLRDFHAFYTNAGVVPASAVSQWTLFLLSPSIVWAKVFYAVGVAAAVSYLVGYRTRLAAIATLVFLISLHHRNQLILNGADTVTRQLLLWSLFSDQGAQYSLDVYVRRRPAYSKIDPIGMRCAQIQVALIYIGAALAKIGGHWFDGTAIYLTLQSPTFSRPVAGWLLQFPRLCFAMTIATLLTEAGFAILVFSPVKNRICRALGLISGVALHVGIALLMRVGQFSPVMIVSYFSFLRSDWLHEALGTASGASAPPRHPIVRRTVAAVLGLHLLWAAALVLGLAPETPRARRPIHRYTQAIGFEQAWSMFYQPPISKLQWSALGTVEDGTRREILSITAPELGESHAWFNTRWTKLQTGLANRPPDLRTLGPYLCRRFAAEERRESLLILELYLTQEDALLPGESARREQDVTLALVQPCRVLDPR